MKRAYSSRAQDAQTANSVDHDAALMCSAHGCPLRWSVDFGTRLCTAHDRADAERWPEVTDWLQNAEADRAFRAQHEQPAPQPTAMQVAAAKTALRRPFRFAKPSRAWAEKLRDREQRGERLNDAQKSMWRRALGQVEATADSFDEAQP